MENAIGKRGGCAECGYIKGAPVKVRVVPGEPLIQLPMRLPEPERCGTCGRTTLHTFTIRPGYEDDDAA
jgi:hypothetical protein